MRGLAVSGMVLAMFVGGSAAPDRGVPDAARDVIGSHTRGVVGSVHDFAGRGSPPGEACRTCHVPHIQAIRLIAPTATQPAGRPATQPAYEMYRMEGQRKVFVPNRYTPGPTSLICLGCHDGTIATSTIGSSHAMLAGVREGFKMPDRAVWRDHPIGVRYPSDPREYHPASFVQARGIRLPDGRIECVSCHDPHNETGLANMLVTSNRRSGLCLTCHIK